MSPNDAMLLSSEATTLISPLTVVPLPGLMITSPPVVPSCPAISKSVPAPVVAVRFSTNASSPPTSSSLVYVHAGTLLSATVVTA